MSNTDGNSPAFYSSGVTMRDYFAEIGRAS